MWRNLSLKRVKPSTLFILSMFFLALMIYRIKDFYYKNQFNNDIIHYTGLYCEALWWELKTISTALLCKLSLVTCQVHGTMTAGDHSWLRWCHPLCFCLTRFILLAFTAEDSSQNSTIFFLSLNTITLLSYLVSGVWNGF